MQRTLATLLYCFILVSAAARADYPDHHERFVNDYTGLLQPGPLAALESKVQAYKQATTIEIAVLIVPTLNGEDPSSYAQGVWRKWHIGKKDDDNGVLLLVVPPPEKKAWIATGTGIQGILTDVHCKHVIDDVMKPLNLKEHRVEAIFAGVDAIIVELAGSPWAEHAKLQPPKKPLTGWEIFFIIVIVVIVLALLIRLLGPVLSDGTSEGGSWSSGDSGGGFGGGDSAGGGGGGDSG